MESHQDNRQRPKVDHSIDMSEEIESREEAFGYRRPSYSRQSSMDTNHAIILGALIIVVGIWGGKLVYDYIQEQRFIRAANYAISYFNESLKQATEQSSTARKRAEAEAKARIQRSNIERKMRQAIAADNERIRKAKLARLEQVSHLISAECQFWWRRDAENPTQRTAVNKATACGVR